MKQPTISTWAKRNFLQWFLDNYSFSSSKSRRILLDLVERKDPLSLLHIIKNGALYRPLLVFSSDDSRMPPCLLITKEMETSDPDQICLALDDLKENDLYVTFYFPNRLESQALLNVIEEPAIEIEPERARTLLFDFELKLFREEDKKANRRKEILERIDDVLASGAKDEFYRLVKELKK